MASNHISSQHKLVIWSWETLQNTIVSLKKGKWGHFHSSSPLLLTLNPHLEKVVEALNCWHKYIGGERERFPLDQAPRALKKPKGVLLIKTENFVVDMHYLIHPFHFFPKLIFSRTLSKKPPFMWSYTFLMWSLHITPQASFFALLTIHSASRICPPSLKAL